MQGGRKQYGLQLQIKGPPKKPTVRPPPTSSFRFNDGDDEDDVEAEIARQANKKRNVRPEVEQQLKKALVEDPNAFDYDEVYEEMKGNQARSIHEDRAKREPKYIGKLLEKAKVRAREQDIVYERQLAKERKKEDHLFGDKEKFVTGAYKKKLQEQAKWLEEERRREREEQKHEVTNKSDMSDFFRNLLKGNVAFGATNVLNSSENRTAADEGSGPESRVEDEELKSSTSTGLDIDANANKKRPSNKDDRSSSRSSPSTRERNDSRSPSRSSDAADRVVDMDDQNATVEENASAHTAERVPARKEGESPKGTTAEVPKRPAADAVAAARERYLARKRQRGL